MTDKRHLEHFKALTGYIDALKKVLDALHSKSVVHCDVKPSNIVLVQGRKDVTAARKASSLFPMLIDFSSTADGVPVATTLWFSSKRLLSEGIGRARASDDLESLFWTAVDVLSKGRLLQ